MRAKGYDIQEAALTWSMARCVSLNPIESLLKMASKYRKKFALPEEFYPILEAYTREVLRDQPVDILEFSYLYFKSLEEGTLDQFDYPKKGENIPPSKHGRPIQQMKQQMQ